MHVAQNRILKFVTEKHYLQNIPILSWSSYAIMLITTSGSEKELFMNNILFFLTPKAMCAFVYDDYTIRQAMEKLESSGYSSLPILSKHGEYRGSISEGDILWAMKNICYMDMRQAEAHRIMEITRKKDNVPVRVTANMFDIVSQATVQNFVPVVDDKDAFIGIITPGAILKYCQGKLFPED